MLKENTLFYSGIIIIIVLFLLVQFFLFSKGFYSISADEAGRTLEAFNWYNGEGSFYSIWLPFTKILYSFAFNIYYDLFYLPRILSSLFGILTLLSLIFLSYELFQDKASALFTGFLGSLFWGLVIFSVIPLAEIYFFFFTITSVAFLLRWKRTGKTVLLGLAVVFSVIGATTRYEAWAFTFLLFIVIAFQFYSSKEKFKTKFIKAFFLFVLLFSFPLYWIYLSYTVTGESTGFMHSVAERYTSGGLIAEFKNNVMYNFFHVNLVSLNIVGLVTLLFFYKNNKQVKIYFLIFSATLIIMSLVSFISKAMPTHNSWRLASAWSIMLLPFTAQWLFILFSDEKKFSKYNFVLFIIVLLFFFNRQTIEFSNLSYMIKEDLITGEFIKDRLISNTDSEIFIEQNGWKYTSLLITSQHPERFITEKKFFDEYGDRNAVNENILESFRKININYLILKPDSDILDNYKYLEEIKRFKDWKIYKLLW